MRSRAPTSRAARIRRWALAVAGSLLVATSAWHASARGEHAEVVAQTSARGGSRTLELDGVRVTVPASWRVVDTDDCEFRFEHWGPPRSPRCGGGEGVWFHASATFDPAHGPGARRNRDGPAWGGYVIVRDLAVVVENARRDVVAAVLRSAR